MANTEVQKSLFCCLTGTLWQCGRPISRFLQQSPGESWRNEQWKGKVVNVFIKDLDENKGFVSVDKTKLRDG